MKKHDENLFQIGEVTKILGTTRKSLLVYEEMGLLTPAVKDEVSGYRYYSADNMTQIRSIRSLQSLGLTLKEVAEYYYDTDNIDAHLQRLMAYIKENNVETTGPFRSIYLEGPPNRGTNSGDYITQIAVPIK